MSDEEIRIKVTVKIVNLLRDAIEKNNNVYSGSLIPNITSITDALTMPIYEIYKVVADNPVIFADCLGAIK